MKHFFRIGVLLFVLALLTGCAASVPVLSNSIEPEPEVDGGATDHTDPNAPKTIQSTEIVEFECYFSTLTDAEPDSELGVGAYRLSAELKDGAVSGTYEFRDHYNEANVKEDFITDLGFFSTLQSFVAEHKLAQNNGLSYWVAGLPDDFGATLSVRYASGERIYASDNQNNFLTRAAMIEMRRLFRGALAAAPELVDLTVNEEYVSDTVNGHIVVNRFPVLEPGCADADGVVRRIEGSEGLYAALQEYNDEVRLRNSEIYRDLRAMTAQAPADREQEYAVISEIYVTRNDSTVVSFFEKTRESGLLRETRTTRARNIWTASGELLGWQDVFTDVGALPALLDAAFHAQYPDLRFNENAASLLRDAISSNSESLCFALTDGAVRVVAAEYYLVPAWVELSVTLPYADYPELVKADYRAAAAARMTRMEYDTDYYADGILVRMSYQAQGEYGDEILWTLSVNGSTLSENFFPHAPECNLIHANDKNYIYLTMPASDVTMRTFVYVLTGGGARKLGEAPLALQGTSCRNPEKMQMAMDDFVFADPMALLSVATCRVGADGMPEPVREDYGLNSVELELLCFASVPTVDPSKPDTEGETRNVPAGTRLTPFRTDRKTYLDFTDKDGNAVRFRIDKFGEDMELVGYGKFSNLFRRPDYTG